MVEVGPEADPGVWLERYGQVDDDIDFAWKCERPIRMGLWQRPYRMLDVDGFHGLHRTQMPGGEWHMKVPCRKCWPCQLQRRREWIARAFNEVHRAERTWFFSGTFRVQPESPDVVVKETQRYLKRLRKTLEIPLRYLFVVETGELRGRLHAHLLIHFQGTAKWKDVVKPWTAGHSKANLLRKEVNAKGEFDENTVRRVFYVAGYVTGDIEFPVRASLRYGRPQPQDDSARTPQPCQKGGGETKVSPLAEGETATPPEVGIPHQQAAVVHSAASVSSAIGGRAGVEPA